jgi:hypothetical protein
MVEVQLTDDTLSEPEGLVISLVPGYHVFVGSVGCAADAPTVMASL